MASSENFYSNLLKVCTCRSYVQIIRLLKVCCHLHVQYYIPYSYLDAYMEIQPRCTSLGLGYQCSFACVIIVYGSRCDNIMLWKTCLHCDWQCLSKLEPTWGIKNNTWHDIYYYDGKIITLKFAINFTVVTYTLADMCVFLCCLLHTVLDTDGNPASLHIYNCHRCYYYSVYIIM
jgi:hypothetical protein